LWTAPGLEQYGDLPIDAHFRLVLVVGFSNMKNSSCNKQAKRLSDQTAGYMYKLWSNIEKVQRAIYIFLSLPRELLWDNQLYLV
jgi:hypothetical protein